MRDNFRILTINVDYPDYPPIAEQQYAAVSLRQRYPGRVAFAATFSAGSLARRHGPRAPSTGSRPRKREGAVGVKIWKNFGMECATPTAATSCRMIRAWSRYTPGWSVTIWCCSGTRQSRSTAGCRLRR